MGEEEDPLEFRKRLEKARTLEMPETSDFKVSGSSKEIEPLENVRTIELDDVKATWKMQGYNLKEPSAPDENAVEKALKRSDPTADYKRNRKDYKIICPVCLGSGKCVKCHGRGRVMLLFKCSSCMGTKKCTECDMETDVDCPQCREPMSRFSDTCKRCGVLLRCPVCGSSLPAMATRCLACKTEFKCGSCKRPYPRQHSWRCPHCLAWNERL